MLNYIKKGGMNVSSNKGFSLLELLVVITILGILTMLSVRQFGNSIEKSNATSDITNAETMASAVLQVMVDKNLTLGSDPIEIVTGDIGDGAGDLLTALKSSGHYTSIPEIKSKKEGTWKWYVTVASINAYSVIVSIGQNSNELIELYPNKSNEYPYNLVD